MRIGRVAEIDEEVPLMRALLCGWLLLKRWVRSPSDRVAARYERDGSLDLKAGPGRRAGLLLVLVGVVLCLDPATAADTSPEPPTIATCRAAWATFNDRLKSLSVEYEFSSQALVEPSVLKRYLGVIRLVDEKHTFAFKGEQRYFGFQRASDQIKDFAPDVEPSPEAPRAAAGSGDARKDGTPALSGLEAVTSKPGSGAKHTFTTAKQSEYAFNGRVRQIRSHDAESLNLVPRAQATGNDALCFDQGYLHAQLRVLPDVFDQADSRASWRLPDALEGDNVSLRPNRESIDGHSCVVVELRKRAIVLWCDPACNYAVRQWEGRKPDTKILCNRYHLGDYRQVAPSVWLPFLIVQEACAPTAPAPYQNVPLMTYTFRVSHLQVNDVPDAMFTLEAPAGTRVSDRTIAGHEDRPVMYQRPVDASRLDATIAQALARQAGKTVPPSGNKWILLVGANVAVVCAAILLFVVRRRRRRTHPKTLVVLALLLSYSSGARGDETVGPITKAALRQQILPLHDAIHVLAVQCTMSALVIDDKPAPPAHSRHHLVVAGQSRLMENIHYTDTLDGSTDLNHTTMFFDGRQGGVFYHSNRYLEIFHGATALKAVWNKTRDAIILRCIGWWPADDETPPLDENGLRMPLRFVLSDPAYVVREGMESIRGHRCVVVERPGVDRLWLDPAAAWALRRREIRKPATKQLLMSFDYDRHAKFQVPGSNAARAIWFPREIVRTIYVPAGQAVGDPPGSGIRTAVRITVDSIRINHDDDLRLTLRLPAGTLVQDRDQHTFAQVPGGADVLDDAVRLATKAYSLQSIDYQHVPMSTYRDSWVQWFVIGAAVGTVMSIISAPLARAVYTGTSIPYRRLCGRST
jgi:hypothetical protein